MSDKYAIINGEMFKEQDATLQISDLAIQRGYGVFDFFRVVNNRPLFLEDHLQRFLYSAESMHLTSKFNSEQIELLIFQLLEKNNMPDSGIKLILTGGYSFDGYSILQSNLIIMQMQLTLPKDIFEKGIKLMTYEYQRQFPRVKTIDYSMGIFLTPVLRKQGADDVLYYYNVALNEVPKKMRIFSKHVLEKIGSIYFGSEFS